MKFWDAIFVGAEYTNDDGEPLVVVGGKALGTVEQVKNVIDSYERHEASSRLERLERRLAQMRSDLPAMPRHVVARRTKDIW